MKYDLIILGSGSVGSAAGYYATQAGLNVLMIDAHMPPHKEGSHHGDTRLIRHAYGEGERYVPLVLRAQTLWDELAVLNEDPIFERTGVVNLGPAHSEFLANVEQSARQFNLNVERLDANAIMKRWPEIAVPEDYIGLFEAESGVLHCETAIKTWISLAEQAGCAQLFNCPVTAVHHHDDGVTVDTPEGQYTASRLLVSAGTWVTKLIPDLPVQPVRKVFSWFQADGRFSTQNKFPAFTGELQTAISSTGSHQKKTRSKLANITAGRSFTHRVSANPLATIRAMVLKPLISYAISCRGLADCCMARPVLTITPPMKILSSTRYRATTTHSSLQA